ncbi:hypothetical protein GCM10025876_38770 [Demequina litorisediminis]|uniref:Coenzyme A biosynthesis bifunctional protein CoaBC n=1 Tax=Demequina litorisediminis TaxID=1849022 RepID=A0ABQ6IID7_9MICO|nr:hypothetical protein GCM10025876_38770 [Demequina litorisediminis]
MIYGAKRARQINSYYEALGEGHFENVGPLVEADSTDKPLSVALREINEGSLLEPGRLREVSDSPMRVLLGVTGGIAAYKAALVLRLLKEEGHDVRVAPTAASLNFVGRATWEALSGHAAPTDTFENVPSVQHVRLGQRADAVIVAPATADFLAQMAAGRATDLLGNALLATEAPVLVCPAMHTEMWNDPSVVANVATLRARGVTVLDPAVGRLTGPDSGPGRLPDPEDIVTAFHAMVDPAHGAFAVPTVGTWGDLDGVNVVISAGGTREPIDAVRYLGNRSSGQQGFALAEAARERGATVTVVAANVSLPLGEGIARVDVETAAQARDRGARRRRRGGRDHHGRRRGRLPRRRGIGHQGSRSGEMPG